MRYLTRGHARETKLKRGLAATLLLLVIAAGCASAATDTASVDEDETVAAVPSAEQSADEEPEEQAVEEPSAEEEPAEEEPVEEESTGEEPVAAESDELETLLIPDLGTTVDIDFSVATDTFGGLGAVAVGRAGETTPVDSVVLFMRPTGFASEDARGSEVPAPLFTETVETWLTHPEIDVVSQSETTVSGFDATVTDFTVQRSDEISQDCGPPPQDQCIFFAATPDPGPFTVIRVRTAQTTRLWEVDQGGELPLVIIAFANEGDDGWLPIVNEAVETAVLGDPQPAPGIRTRAVEPGSHTFDSLGGMTLDVPVAALALEGTQCVLLQFPDDRFEAGMIIGRLDQDQGGVPIETLDDYMALSQGAIVFTETGQSIELFGTTLSQFDMELIGENPSAESCAPIGGDIQNDVTAGFIGIGSAYLADAEDGGVYIVSWATIIEEEAALYEGIFDEIVPTIEVTGG